MIVPCKSGAQVVIGECPWVPGAYLSIGNVRGSQGAIVDPEALDQVIAELTRVRDEISGREAEKQQKRKVA
jgi:hypothetical protein